MRLLGSFAFLSLLVVAACGSSRGSEARALERNPSRPVPLGEWCGALGKGACARIGECLGSSAAGAGCEDSVGSSCTGGRPPAAASGRVAADLAHCLDIVDALTCDGFLGGLASHAECQARVAP